MTVKAHDATAVDAATDTAVGPLRCVDANPTVIDDEASARVIADAPRQNALIRNVRLRRVLDRADSSLQTLGRFFDLAVQSFRHLIVDVIRLRHPWRDTVNQAWFIISVTAIPALLVSIPFGVIVAVQVGSFIQQVGASSISGAAGGLAVIRQGAPMVAALLLGGAAGSAVATDLGARTIREEVDALRVMGIDPVRRLVTPRLAAIVFVAPVLCSFIIFMGLAAGYAINVGFQGGTPGSYIASFASFASVSDVVVAMLKTWLFGVVVVLVACQRGLEAKGGARGVADAVNASVVIGVVAVFILNLIITQGVSMSMPLRMG
ncbi:putative YrbE family protein [Mycolicibacterium pulveris]|uniref:Putative YrbE family protein n=1 Tax=Mycolicibacterium pulveris TaxID=36813 RepID=A0A7I7UDI3_MYCPV|nr:putative YrbE family protein [Mycolicibacterium pulveris]